MSRTPMAALALALAAGLVSTIPAAAQQQRQQREGIMVTAGGAALTNFGAGLPMIGAQVTQVRPGRLGLDAGVSAHPAGFDLVLPEVGLAYTLRSKCRCTVMLNGGLATMVREDEGDTSLDAGIYAGAAAAIPVAGRFGLRFGLGPRWYVTRGMGIGVLASVGIGLLP